MGLTRQIIFGIAPRDGAAFTLSYTDIADGNSSAKAFTCAIAPATRGSGVSLSQTTLFLGTTAANLTYQTMRSDKGQDEATPVIGTFVTNRIDPDNRSDSQQIRRRTTKRFRRIGMVGFEPSRTGLEVSYARDADPILDSSTVVYESFEAGGDDSELEFPNGLCEFFHLRGTDSGNNAGQIVLSNFDVEYYTVGRRPGRDS